MIIYLHILKVCVSLCVCVRYVCVAVQSKILFSNRNKTLDHRYYIMWNKMVL